MTCKAGMKEIAETVQLAIEIAKLNVSLYAMKKAIEQVKMEMTTQITIGKEKEHEQSR